MHSEDWARQSATCGSGPASERPRTESLKKDFCHVRRKNPKEDRNPSTWKQIFQLKSAYVCVYVRCVTACVWVWVGVCEADKCSSFQPSVWVRIVSADGHKWRKQLKRRKKWKGKRKLQPRVGPKHKPRQQNQRWGCEQRILGGHEISEENRRDMKLKQSWNWNVKITDLNPKRSDSDTEKAACGETRLQPNRFRKRWRSRFLW